MNRLPDRTGIIVFPACMALASWIFAAIMMAHLWPSDTPSWERPVLESMLIALAQSLGPIGVAVLVLVIVGPTTFWLVRAYRQYAALVAADRAKMKL